MHSLRSGSLAGIALTLLLLLASACSHAAGRSLAHDTWTRSYPAGAGARFELVNTNGAIHAEAWDGASVELVGQRTARAVTEAGARELLAKTEMREDVSDHGARVEVITPESFGVSQVEVSWTLRVPKGVAVDLETANGRISLTGLSGAVRAETVNGSINGASLATTDLSAESVNGGVQIELTTPLASGGRVAIESVNGAVSLALPAESRASLSAEVVNGAIDARDLALQKTGESSRTELVGTLNGGGARVTLETVNGAARITRSRVADGASPPAAAPEPATAPADESAA